MPRAAAVFVLAVLGPLGAALAGGPEAGTAAAGKPPADARWNASTFASLRLRSLGPALFGGRIADFAVHPTKRSTYYAAVSSGGVWKTVNHGTTWEPVFDAQGSSSIGCIALDPRDPQIVWVGTGENNGQRTVGYGDGVYRSADGGRTWERRGLEDSQHVAKIVVDPRGSATVWAAAQGPLWSSGGDRGLYKTTDAGRTWKPSLRIGDDTGVTDVALDPRDPDVLYAAAYQRRRHPGGMVHGGPESGLYKTTDGGASWQRAENGLPRGEMGRIGLALSPADPDVLYATVEAVRPKGGFFRSTDAGASWERRSPLVAESPPYYGELVADPKNVGRVYLMDALLRRTEDGGQSWKTPGFASRHVDDHALWIDPDDPGHLLVGGDGGVYDSWDGGESWGFKANLPVLQLYRVAVDDAAPFYHVYGGSQDSHNLGGPSRTASINGIVNSDWFVTLRGDGFRSAADPLDPSLVYAAAQYGNLVRYDRRSGEALPIQPQPPEGEAIYRFGWDAPLVLSPHSPTRLYLAAQRVLRSDDRGGSWRPVSPDLTRPIDRARLSGFEGGWSADPIVGDPSREIPGNIVALAESPLAEGLLYAGTDDGRIQVTGDGGAHWRASGRFPGVPELASVSHLAASAHARDTVYAAFNDTLRGDFRPYLLKSADRGATWSPVAGDLPAPGGIWTFAEDPVEPGLLFVGTEFGLYFTGDGGRRWIRLTGGLPTVAVRDLALQRRESDLVVGTFGRGLYILDDLAALRHATPERLEEDGFLVPVRPTWIYQEVSPLGHDGKGFQGDAYFAAPNPPFGALFTYYLRQDAGAGGTPEARVILTVTDARGEVVRRLSEPARAGFHRRAWDLRLPPTAPGLAGLEDGLEMPQERGPLVMPGTYTVALALAAGGEARPLGEARSFEVRSAGLASLPAEDPAEAFAFRRETTRLRGAVQGAVEAAAGARDRLRRLEEGGGAAAPPALAEARALDREIEALQIELSGDRRKIVRKEAVPLPIAGRVEAVAAGWSSSSAPTGTHRESLRIAAEQFAPVLARLTRLIEVDLAALEERLGATGPR